MVGSATAGVSMWPHTRLAEVASLQRGHDLTWRERKPGKVPVMGSAGRNGVHERAIADGPGVVLGRSGASFGQAHYSVEPFWPHNTALYVTNFHGNNPRFIYYLLDYIDFQRYNSGGAQQSLNRNFIANIAVSIPPADEQIRIARALDDAGDAIAALERIIAKKKAIKQGLMQQLLTCRARLPDFADDWTESTIGSLARVVGGGTPSTRVSAYWNGDIPWFTPAEIAAEGSGLVSSSERRITPEGLASSAATLLPAGSVLVTSRASIGNCAVAAVQVTTNQGFASMVPADRRSTWFLYYWVQQNRSRLESRSAGSTFLEISASKVALIPLASPSLPEQEAIGGVLSDADAELDALKRRLVKANDIKAGMMQELLSGRTRLPEKEAVV